jgi:hypothetical protein
MKSIFDFIVEPYGQRYNNEIKVGDKSLIINTKSESFKSVNNIAKVIAVPKAYKTPVKPGDLIMIHHNVFRRFFDIRGQEKNSKSYFKDGMYFVQLNQVYLYKSKDKWKAFGDRCFINPIHNNDDLDANLEERLIGILKYGNSEYDFIVDGKRLYCMKSNDIVIKYERQGNEKEYNPSWAHSG